MDRRSTFLSNPKTIEATGKHPVAKFYEDDQILAVAEAGKLHGLDEVKFGQLRTRLDGAAMWFRLAHGARGLVPEDRTTEILQQIDKRAEKVRKHADQILAKRHSKAGSKGPIPDRMLERFQAVRQSLNSLLGVEKSGNGDLAAGPDPRGADAEDVAEKRMAFLVGPVGRALNTPGPTNETPLEVILERLADPDCPIDVIRDLADELAARARDGAERLAPMRSNMIRSGNSGDYAMNVWLDDVLNIYKAFSRKKASITVSVKPETFGFPEGPALGFVMAAFEPIRRDIVRQNDQAREDKRPLPFDKFYELQGSDAWSSRIRTAIEHRAKGASEIHTPR